MATNNVDGGPSGFQIFLVILAALIALGCAGLGLSAWFVQGRVATYTRDARVASTKALIINVEQAIQAYRLQHRALPASLDDLVGDGTLDAESVPPDAWGRPLRYQPGEDGRTFELLSYGEDGVEGGEGKAADITPAVARGR